jgi:hypothetical protein
MVGASEVEKKNLKRFSVEIVVVILVLVYGLGLLMFLLLLPQSHAMWGSASAVLLFPLWGVVVAVVRFKLVPLLLLSLALVITLYGIRTENSKTAYLGLFTAISLWLLSLLYTLMHTDEWY